MSENQNKTFYTVNVFTTKPFSGNPLAIVLDTDNLSDAQMQLLAREFNLPETIFIQQADDSNNTAKVRIFTPVNELPFAGHPTVGCAIFLAEQNRGAESFSDEIRLEEVAGLVPVTVTRENGITRAELTAPVIPKPCGLVSHDALSKKQSSVELTATTAASAIGVQPNSIAHTPMAHVGGPTFIFIPLNSVNAVNNAKPVQPLCDELTAAYGATGLYVYHLNEQNAEIDARMFAPAAGIPEDPATGSAAAILGSQLLNDKQLLEGVNSLTLRQGYAMGRPSQMQLTMHVVNDALTAVRVRGSSVAIGSGTIRLPE